MYRAALAEAAGAAYQARHRALDRLVRRVRWRLQTLRAIERVQLGQHNHHQLLTEVVRIPAFSAIPSTDRAL